MFSIVSQCQCIHFRNITVILWSSCEREMQYMCSTGTGSGSGLNHRGCKRLECCIDLMPAGAVRDRPYQ